MIFRVKKIKFEIEEVLEYDSIGDIIHAKIRGKRPDTFFFVKLGQIFELFEERPDVYVEKDGIIYFSILEIEEVSFVRYFEEM